MEFGQHTLEVLRQPIGQRILRYASLDDIAIWGVLALILMDWERIGRQGAFLLAFGIAAWLFHQLMARLGERDRWYVALIWLETQIHTISSAPASKAF